MSPASIGGEASRQQYTSWVVGAKVFGFDAATTVNLTAPTESEYYNTVAER